MDKEHMMVNTLIVGASVSGLAAAAVVQRQHIEYCIIEKESEVAAPWRRHYDRLHLHTCKRLSNLPYKKFGKTIPRYPSRQQVIDYLEDYQRSFDITPLFHTQAISIKKEDDHWITTTNNGQIRSKYVIMATGAYGKPKPVHFPGDETFPGRVLHSYEYRSGQDFRGQKVLLVGFGNSACEIAIDLCEQGAMPAMAVRSPVNVIPRDILGVPVLELSLLLSHLPPRIADIISRPLVRGLIGDITKLGLRQKAYGPLEMIQREGNAPVLDIGTVRYIREGRIGIYGDIDHIEGDKVYFRDGREDSFQAIVAGIGYYKDHGVLEGIGRERLEDLRNPVDQQRYFGKDGLYFCGYWVSPTGQIREIARDAIKIAGDIAERERLK